MTAFFEKSYKNTRTIIFGTAFAVPLFLGRTQDTGTTKPMVSIVGDSKASGSVFCESVRYLHGTLPRQLIRLKPLHPIVSLGQK